MAHDPAGSDADVAAAPYADSLALADELLNASPDAASGQLAVGEADLWRLVDVSHIGESVRAKITSLVGHRGVIDEQVLNAASREVDLAQARIRLSRTLLAADMFAAIRAPAERAIDDELAELDAIVPELIEAHRSSVEQQQRIAAHLAEIHRIEMEGELKRDEIRKETARDQSTMWAEQMARDREAANKRNELFLQGFRGSRY